MRPVRPSRRAAALASPALSFLLLVVLAAPGCDSPTDRQAPRPMPIALSQVVEGTVAAGDSLQYDLDVHTQSDFAVELEVQSGEVTVTVRDTAGATPAVTLRGSAAAASGGWTRSAPVRVSATTRYRLRVTGTGTFRLRVAAPTHSRRPEWRDSMVVIGDTIAGEDFYVPSSSAVVGDEDMFTFHGRAGDELLVYLQAMAPDPHGGVTLMVERDGDTLTVYAPPANRPHAELERQASPRFRLPADGTYRLHVTSVDAWEGGGFATFPYRFQIRRVERRPERLDSIAAIGAMLVGESLDYVGDIDEFILRGSAGEEYNVLFRSAGGDPAAQLRLEVPDADPDFTTPRTVESTGRDSVIVDSGTGILTLPATGRLTLRVLSSGVDSWGGTTPWVGAYELHVHRVRRAPETTPASLAFGDSVIAERLEMPGDIDEFRVDVPTGATANLRLDMDSTSWWSEQRLQALEAELVVSATGQQVSRADLFMDPAWSTAGGTFAVQPGSYLLRVRASDGRSRSYFGGYRVYLYDIHDTPEGVPPLLAFGDTVSERLDPIGDADTFLFDGARGDHVDVLIQGTGTATSGGFALTVARPGSTSALATAWTRPASPSLESGRTGRITLPATGRYEIRLTPTDFGRFGADHGPYRLALRRLGAAPERHGAELAPGDQITDEALDVPGDADEFTLHGTPGGEAMIFLTASDETRGLLVEVLDPATKAVVCETISVIATESTGHFTFPAGGALLVRVSERRRDPQAGYELQGGYRLEPVAVNRAPEQVDALIAVGDTVEGEAVDPHGDVDEYQFTGVAGSRVVVYFQTPLGTDGIDGLVVELLEPGTGRVLASASSRNPTARLEDIGTPPVLLPTTGSYTVRVRGLDERSGRGQYRFTVRAVP
jgi:hypothetical protein